MNTHNLEFEEEIRENEIKLYHPSRFNESTRMAPEKLNLGSVCVNLEERDIWYSAIKKRFKLSFGNA
jgi:hypothetical protein